MKNRRLLTNSRVTLRTPTSRKSARVAVARALEATRDRAAAAEVAATGHAAAVVLAAARAVTAAVADQAAAVAPEVARGVAAGVARAVTAAHRDAAAVEAPAEAGQVARAAAAPVTHRRAAAPEVTVTSMRASKALKQRPRKSLAANLTVIERRPVSNNVAFQRSDFDRYLGKNCSAILCLCKSNVESFTFNLVYSRYSVAR